MANLVVLIKGNCRMSIGRKPIHPIVTSPRKIVRNYRKEK